jgi:hypothetical protein
LDIGKLNTSLCSQSRRYATSTSSHHGLLFCDMSFLRRYWQGTYLLILIDCIQGTGTRHNGPALESREAQIRGWERREAAPVLTAPYIHPPNGMPVGSCFYLSVESDEAS